MGCSGSTENVKKNTQLLNPKAWAELAKQKPVDNYDQAERPPSDTIATFIENSYQHQETNFDDIYNIRHNLQSEMNELDMDSVFGDNEIRKFYNRNDIDNESMNTAVKESLFEEHWEKTWYYKWFSTTKRNEDLFEAINDLFEIAPRNKATFMNFYKEFKDTPQKVVTLIWTYEPKKQGEIRIYKLINMALIIDAKNIFGDALKGNIKFATDFISQCNIDDVDHIIKHSIKFIRILNTALVDEGSKFNACERVTYRGVDK